MKLQLLNFLKVCLLTLVVLSPALGVISVVWQQHLDFMSAKHLLLAVKDNQQLITNANNQTIDIVLWLMFFSPVSFCLAMAVYDRYMTYRAAALQRQVEMLERIWQRHIYLEGIIL
ncbi:hypothetical protein [Nostoc sp. FACHB-110]|uniref:hypothetical protein n=1 Tax=Nostoc sp. FACHB-110 TaxID=2692834 RepID=UPI0016877293|nr:hypothetical protein [Nostoc sp. FACHB-110]MBD2438427.1 hypothetical protein [Nostoc sp. FACHB-110]